MNIKQMRAANAKINPTKATKATAKGDQSTLTQKVAIGIGAAPSHVVGFFSDISASYTYHEAVRKSQL